jgi:hypothetical protein
MHLNFFGNGGKRSDPYKGPGKEKPFSVGVG